MGGNLGPGAGAPLLDLARAVKSTSRPYTSLTTILLDFAGLTGIKVEELALNWLVEVGRVGGGDETPPMPFDAV